MHQFSYTANVLIILTWSALQNTLRQLKYTFLAGQSTVGSIVHTLLWEHLITDTDKQQIQGHFSVCISFQTDDIKVWETENSHRGPGPVKTQGVEGWPSPTPNTRSQCVPCERVHYYAKVGGTSVLFWGSDFWSSSSVFFIEFSCDHTTFWHWNLNDWTLMSEKKSHTKPSSLFLFVWQYLDVSHFWWPNSLRTLPLGFKIINTGLITSNHIVKNHFAVFRVQVQKCFYHCYMGPLLFIC